MTPPGTRLLSLRNDTKISSFPTLFFRFFFGTRETASSAALKMFFRIYLVISRSVPDHARLQEWQFETLKVVLRKASPGESDFATFPGQGRWQYKAAEGD